MMNNILRIALLCGACLGSNAYAIDYFMQIDGIDGDSASRGHEKWVDVDTFSWGVTNSTPVGGGGGGSGKGKTTFAPFGWTQHLDSSTVPLFLEVAGGTHTPNVIFEAEMAGRSQYVFFRMAFENVQFTALNISGDPSSVQVDGKLVYDKITMTYWPQKKDGSRGDPIVGAWDVNAAKPFSGDPNALMGLFLAGPTSFDIRQLTPVPEPQTWALMGLGVLALAALRRRRDARA